MGGRKKPTHFLTPSGFYQRGQSRFRFSWEYLPILTLWHPIQKGTVLQSIPNHPKTQINKSIQLCVSHRLKFSCQVETLKAFLLHLLVYNESTQLLWWGDVVSLTCLKNHILNKSICKPDQWTTSQYFFNSNLYSNSQILATHTSNYYNSYTGKRYPTTHLSKVEEESNEKDPVGWGGHLEAAVPHKPKKWRKH